MPKINFENDKNFNASFHRSLCNALQKSYTAFSENEDVGTLQTLTIHVHHEQ